MRRSKRWERPTVPLCLVILGVEFGRRSQCGALNNAPCKHGIECCQCATTEQITGAPENGRGIRPESQAGWPQRLQGFLKMGRTNSALRNSLELCILRSRSSDTRREMLEGDPTRCRLVNE